MRARIEIIRGSKGIYGLVLPVRLSNPTHHVWKILNFRVDTGSQITVISEKDALDLGLPYESFVKSPIDLLGFGGPQELREFSRVDLRFPTDMGLASNPMAKIFITRELGRRDKMGLKSTLKLPSVLGLDFFDAHKWKLVVDLGAGQAYLEK